MFRFNRKDSSLRKHLRVINRCKPDIRTGIHNHVSGGGKAKAILLIQNDPTKHRPIRRVQSQSHGMAQLRRVGHHDFRKSAAFVAHNFGKPEQPVFTQIFVDSGHPERLLRADQFTSHRFGGSLRLIAIAVGVPYGPSSESKPFPGFPVPANSTAPPGPSEPLRTSTGMSGGIWGVVLFGTWEDKIKILDESLNWIANFIWLKMRLLGRSLRAASSGVCW